MASADATDLLIVGAGPAGMAAAVEAARLGLSVSLIDEQRSPGGQIYRGFASLARAEGMLFGREFYHGLALINAAQGTSIRRYFGATLWYVSRDIEAAVSNDGGATLLKAKSLLIATGAVERPFPILGWTVPGVMTAGSAQVALKCGGSLPDGTIVLAGGGPLLYLVARQLLSTSANVTSILDTTPPENYRRALSKLPRALRAPSYLAKGIGMLAALHRRGVIIRHVTELKVKERTGGLAVTYSTGRAPQSRSIEADWVLLHQGVVPNVQVPRALDCAMRWNEDQACFVPVVDEWGETTVPRVFCAGDGAGIGGASVAAISGQLAAQRIARKLGAITEDAMGVLSRPLLRLRARHLAVRPFLDALYRPPLQFRVPADPAVLVCRCEEVTAGEISQAVELGAIGPNQAKFFCRCGMGPCQGRMCGLTLTEMIAEKLSVPREQVGYFRVRPPIKPVRLSELASISPEVELNEVHFS
jgi:thioredoxin reductase/bacterioferritin-associated ferredoxin